MFYHLWNFINIMPCLVFIYYYLIFGFSFNFIFSFLRVNAILSLGFHFLQSHIWIFIHGCAIFGFQWIHVFESTELFK